MKTPVGLRRREVLRLLAAIGAAGLGGGGSGTRADAAPSRESLVAERLRARLVSPESASFLGAAYLRDHPEEASVARLASDLGLAASTSDAGSSGDAAAAIAARHRDDLRSGRVHRLDGFGFSRTELRLCALLYLTERS